MFLEAGDGHGSSFFFGEAFMLYYALIGSRVRQTCDNLVI